MLTDTPCTEMNGLKKPHRLKIPRIPYDENDSVMKDIQERMKQKRKKKTDLNRSRRLNLTNASLMLKLSLRANNRALAKALEDAHCEARQDKEMIFELQCALEAAQHELRQCHQMIQDLKLESQSMIGMLTTLQESEECHRKRVAEVKSLLNEVTAKYLLNTVALIDKAADICNTPSLSKASSIFIRKSSVSEDDSSRDTFSALITEAQGLARSNIYCGNAKTTKGEEVMSEVLSEPVPELSDQTESHVNDVIAIDEATISTSDNKTESPLRRHSSTSRKHSRTAFFLDPKEMQHALASEAGHHIQICEEKEELSCLGLDYTALTKDEKPQEDGADDLENEVDQISSVHSISNTDKVEISDKDHCALEKTDYREQDMELTQKDEKELQVDASQGDVPDQAEPQMDEMPDREVARENKTTKKTKGNGKTKKGKVRKNSTQKQLKKLSVKKAIPKLGDEGDHCTSIFDLSVGESFSKSVSPHRPQMKEKFEKNLSTESEKSEPGETSSSGAGNRSDGPIEGSVEKREGEGEKNMKVKDESPEKTLEVEEKPKTCRRSRQSHGTLRHGAPSAVEEISGGPIGGTVLASPLGEEMSVPHRTLKPFSQVLNESSCKEGADIEDSNALLMKAKLKKTIKPKQKKRLYDPKKSLDKEFTHTVINSSQDVGLPCTENGSHRSSSRFNRRHRSGTVAKDERAKEICNESLISLLEESWMKDFLNDIDGEDELKCTARTSVSRKKSQVKTRATRITFKMDSKDKVSNEEARRPSLESNENGLKDDEPLETKDQRTKGNEGKVIRRGTVCLKKKSEGLLVDGNSESALRVSRDYDLDEIPGTGDVVNKDGMSDLMVGKGRVKNFASFVMMGENNKEPVVEKGRNVVRRGTFDIKPQEEEEDSNVGKMIEDNREKSGRKSEKKDKIEGRQQKRKSDIVEEEFDGDRIGRKSRKRQKRDNEKDIERVAAEEEEDPIEDDKMVKRNPGRESNRSVSGKPYQRRKTRDVEKEEIKELNEKPEVEEDILEVEDNLFETKDGYNDEDEEQCSQFKQHKMGDGGKAEQAKLDQKQSKISKVPRPKKKMITVEYISDENASHDDSISSVESESVKRDKPKKHQSGIPRRKEGSKSLQKFCGNAKRKENNSIMNGSCLKLRNLDVKGQGVISGFEDVKKVTVGEEEKAKETEMENLDEEHETKVSKRTLVELKNEAAGNKQDDEERGLAEEKTLEEQALIKEQQTIDNEQRCDEEGVCEVNESGDASTSIPEETGGTEETVEADAGRRPSRQARAKAAKSLKEPSLSRKLRRGDPFTDNMLLTSPMVKIKKNKKQKKVSQNPKSRSALGDATNVI